MSDDEEMESFGVNDEDFERAMNPGARRHGKMSKEEAMLGVWANDDSDNDNDDDDKFSYGQQKERAQQTFVKSATASFTKKASIVFEDDESGASDTEERKVTTSRPFARTTSATTAATTKSTQSNNAKSSKRPAAAPAVDRKEIHEIGAWEKNTKGIGMKLLQKMGWEKGKGIGKEMQGRAVPVQAVLRKGKGAVGSYGAESKEAKSKWKRTGDGDESDEGGEAIGDGDEDETSDKDERIVNESQWKKTKSKGGKQVQYKHRTPEQLVELAARQPSKLRRVEHMLDGNTSSGMASKTLLLTDKMKIIDMTGKEQRVMHGYESIAHMTKSSSSRDASRPIAAARFDLPELRQNLDLLVNTTEDKILHADKKYKHYEDMIVSLSYEEKKTSERMRVEQQEIGKLENLELVIEKLEKSAKQDNVTVAELIVQFRQLQLHYADEFLIFDLTQLIIPLVTPLLQKRMSTWRPFSDDGDDDDDYDNPADIAYMYEAYADLRELLDKVDTRPLRRSIGPMSAFNRIMWETWMPALRRCLAQAPSIKTCSLECADLIDKWRSLLPKWIVANILEQMIMPKLTADVDEWNPLTDRIPIHTWIHPWLPLLKERLESSLFPQIRFKLANALTHWHPSDMSAKAMLSAWQPPVFSQSSWDTFLQRHIVGKLGAVFDAEFVVNPREQSMDAWNWTMDWHDLLPQETLVEMLERSFFPKWLNVLCIWLNSSPDYEHISQWYAGWKQLFSADLQKHATVKARLGQALTMMDRSTRGIRVTYTPGALPTTTAAQAAAAAAAASTSMETQPIIIDFTKIERPTFKQMIEKKAQAHNLIFMPVSNRFVEGKQVYKLGHVSLYISGHVLFMLQPNGVWFPTDIDKVVHRAATTAT